MKPGFAPEARGVPGGIGKSPSSPSSPTSENQNQPIDAIAKIAEIAKIVNLAVSSQQLAISNQSGQPQKQKLPTPKATATNHAGQDALQSRKIWINQSHPSGGFFIGEKDHDEAADY
jgi:hypothetical protein